MKYPTTILILLLFKCSFSQNKALYVPLEISDTYNNQTRGTNGKPGDNYFQNFSDYHIKVKIDPFNKTILGYETIFYQNNSPDTLNYLILDLHQNLFKKGHKRAKNIHINDVGKSVFIDSIFVGEKLVDKEVFVKFWGTKMKLKLAEKLLPKDSVKLSLKWNYSLATETKTRTGVYDATTMFIGYWYPQISVYDDIDGWDMSSYDGLHEFYSDFANYNVEIELPENFVVWATGELKNPKTVLSDKIYTNYKAATKSSKSVKIISSADLQKGLVTKLGQNKWIFKADSVPDFAFGLSNKYCWDATSIEQNNGKTFNVHTAYNPDSKDYNKTIDMGRDIITDLSNNVATPYPFPQISLFNGAGAMEFPMITNFGTEPDLNGILFTQSHEYMHNYFPFLVYSNQKKYAWIDEGLVTYLTASTQKKLGDNFDPLPNHIKVYESFAGKEQDEILMTSSHFLNNKSYIINSYFKSCAAFHVLHNLIGKERFSWSINDFINNWQYKHPLPYDLFNTFNRVSGENLNWFWDKWFFQKGYPDLAISKLTFSNFKINIQIDNIGGFPTAIYLRIYDGEKVVKDIYIDARVWKNKDSHIIEIEFNKEICKLEIGNELIPDVNKTNNVYLID